jgi:hypothetical protein
MKKLSWCIASSFAITAACSLGHVLVTVPASAQDLPKATPSAPAAWPRYGAVIAKDAVNLRVEPSVRARLAAARAPKGTAIEVQRAGEPHWYEILDPDEYRGFFVREDMLTVDKKAK